MAGRRAGQGKEDCQKEWNTTAAEKVHGQEESNIKLKMG